MSELLNRIGRPNAFTWQVAVIAVVPSLVLVLAGPWARAGGSPLPWMAIALVGTAAAAVAMAPFRVTVLKAGERKSRPWLTLLAFAIAGMVRAVLIGQIAHRQGLLASPESGHRMVSGALSGVIDLSIIALMVQSVRDHSDSISRLSLEKNRLALARAGARIELERVRAEIVERVRGQLIGRLEALVSGFGETAGRLSTGAEALVRLIDATLKPLAEEISARSKGWEFEPAEVDLRTVRGGSRLFADSTRFSPINPAPTAVALALGGSASFMPLAGPIRMIAAGLVVAGGVWVLLTLCVAPMRWASRTLGTFGRTLTLTALLYATGLAVTALVLLVWIVTGLGLESRIQISLLAFSPFVVLLVGWGIAVTAAWNRRAGEIDSELDATNESLKAQLAYLEAEVGAERDRLARFVHGPVQDRLIAAWGVLERSDHGHPSDADLSAAADLIGEALELLGQGIANSSEAVDSPPTVAELVDGYAAVWEGLVAIECSVAPETEESLARDPVASGAVGEVIREAIANAARHARSERISVSVTEETAGLVLVLVEADARNGATASSSSSEGAAERRGLGSRTLDQITHSWSLETLATGSRLTATVRVSPSSMFV